MLNLLKQSYVDGSAFNITDLLKKLILTNKDKLNLELGWETIMERGKILGLNLFQKIHLHETRPLIRNCMTKLDFEKKVLTRSKGGYIPHINYGKQFKMSFFPYFSGLWNFFAP